MVDLAPERKRGRNWLVIVLVASLAVNAFFAAALVTEFLRFRRIGDRSEPHAARMELRWLRGSLPSQSVAGIETALDKLRPDIKMRIERLRTLRAELRALVAAPEPDRAAIDSHLREIRLQVGAMQDQIQTRIFDAVLALPADERARLAPPPTSGN